MSSSQRRREPSPAYLTTDTRPTGAMLLPAVSPLAFIDEFNAIYQSLGLSIVCEGTVMESVTTAPVDPEDSRDDDIAGPKKHLG